MNTRLIALVAITATTSISASAGSFAERCPDIAACANYVGQLLEQKYVFDKDIKGSIQSTSNVDINRDNAELLFTFMLYNQGFTRIPLMGAPNTFQILRTRDMFGGLHCPSSTCRYRYV